MGDRVDLFGGSNTQGEGKQTPVIRVYEMETGVWTHDFSEMSWSDGNDDEGVGQAAAINSAHAMADRNGTTIWIDFPIEMQDRAKRLGIDLYAKPQRKRM